MIEFNELVDSVFNYYWDFTIIERTDYFLRFICFGAAAICLLFCLFNWSFGARDFGFVSSMILTYMVAKLYLTMVEGIVSEQVAGDREISGLHLRSSCLPNREFLS
jgi:hypothetical protein